MNYSKEIVKGKEYKVEAVEYIAKGFDITPPLVGDYYEEPQKKPKNRE